MAVWQDNLKRLLLQKEVLILHGNVRDSGYIKKDGTLILNLTEFIRQISRELNFQRLIFWGVFFGKDGRGHSPMWSLERIESFDGECKLNKIDSQDKEVILLTRWLEEEIKRIDKKTIFIINYIDKITPYSQRGAYPKDIALLITLIQKIIENIPENNRLVMIALQDTMIPIEYYTNSPKVAVLEIPIPDKEERKLYFSKHLRAFPSDRIDFLSNITEGLYFKDLDNILRDIVDESQKQQDLSLATLRRLVNRYRIGTEEDPWTKLSIIGLPKGLIDSAESWFKERVIGQDHAIEETVKAIKKARAGVVGLSSGQASKPKAVFFFAGPTGVGKTFMAKKLAEYLFDTEEAFLRFDMSEFKEEHTVSKLIGSPPGYVGYDKGGMLTNAAKNRPFSVILFDEIEKAHPKIMDIFLQILDDGRLTDSRGQTVFFTESVIIFTSNIGTRTNDSRGHQINERAILEQILNDEKDPTQQAKKVREHFIKAVQEFFMYEISRPELLNRIGSHIIAFNYIYSEDAKRNIIESKLKEIAENFKDKFSNLGYRLKFADGVKDYFFNKHSSSIEKFGGRGLVNAIDDETGYILADQLLLAEKNTETHITFLIYLDGEKLKCKRESSAMR